MPERNTQYDDDARPCKNSSARTARLGRLPGRWAGFLGLSRAPVDKPLGTGMDRSAVRGCDPRRTKDGSISYYRIKSPWGVWARRYPTFEDANALRCGLTNPNEFMVQGFTAAGKVAWSGVDGACWPHAAARERAGFVDPLEFDLDEMFDDVHGAA